MKTIIFDVPPISACSYSVPRPSQARSTGSASGVLPEYFVKRAAPCDVALEAINLDERCTLYVVFYLVLCIGFEKCVFESQAAYTFSECNRLLLDSFVLGLCGFALAAIVELGTRLVSKPHLLKRNRPCLSGKCLGSKKRFYKFYLLIAGCLIGTALKVNSHPTATNLGLWFGLTLWVFVCECAICCALVLLYEFVFVAVTLKRFAGPGKAATETPAKATSASSGGDVLFQIPEVAKELKVPENNQIPYVCNLASPPPAFINPVGKGPRALEKT